jgi:zinc protease
MPASPSPFAAFLRRAVPRAAVVAILAAPFALVPSPTQAQSGRAVEERPEPPHPVWGASPPTITRLPNGLTVVTVRRDTPGILAYYTLVRVGSRDEVEPGHSGFAHLFEHMMFRGTERFPQEAYERTIQTLGADNNAYTTNDFTCYTVTAPSSALARVVELEADRFQHLRYDEAQFRTETGAVLGEYNKSASSPDLRLEETLMEMAFTRHTYGHTTLGYLRDVQAMPGYFDYSQAFFRRFYTPDAATVIVAGDVDHAQVVALVTAQYGGWRGRRDRARIPVEPEPRAGARRFVPWDGASPPRVMIGYRTPAFDGGFSGTSRRDVAGRAAALKETAALQIVHALAFSTSSPLYQRLVVDERKLLELRSYAGNSLSLDPGVFVIDATLPEPASGDASAPPADRDAMFAVPVNAIQASLADIASGRTPAERIRDVQSRLRYARILELETPDDVANLIAQTVAVGGDLARLDEYLAALVAVTPEDVARVAGRYLVEGRRFVVTLAPGVSAPPATAPSTGGAR